MSENRDWYLVTYPNGVKMIEEYTPAEAEVKSRAVNRALVKVNVSIDPMEGSSIMQNSTLTIVQSDLHARRVAYGYTVLEFFGGHKLTLILCNHSRDDLKNDTLRLPLPAALPPMWISPDSTIDQIAKAAGVISYDLAIPLGWARANLDPAGDYPLGVWSYDVERIMGEFFSLDQMLGVIAGELLKMGLGALGLPTIDHNPQHNRPMPSVKEGYLITAGFYGGITVKAYITRVDPAGNVWGYHLGANGDRSSSDCQLHFDRDAWRYTFIPPAPSSA